MSPTDLSSSGETVVPLFRVHVSPIVAFTHPLPRWVKTDWSWLSKRARAFWRFFQRWPSQWRSRQTPRRGCRRSAAVRRAERSGFRCSLLDPCLTRADHSHYHRSSVEFLDIDREGWCRETRAVVSPALLGRCLLGIYFT